MFCDWLLQIKASKEKDNNNKYFFSLVQANVASSSQLSLRHLELPALVKRSNFEKLNCLNQLNR